MSGTQRWLLATGTTPEDRLRAEDLPAWRTPAVVARVLVAPVGAARVVPSADQAPCLDAQLRVGRDRLVGLVRRDGVGLAELTAAPAAALADELDRVLAVLGGRAGGGPEVRTSRDGYTALCAAGTSPVLGRATRVLEATLTGERGAVTGALWYDADGWWRVAVVGAEVVLRPGIPCVRDWAPLLDQVLV